jgi:hypothetical protein
MGALTTIQQQHPNSVELGLAHTAAKHANWRRQATPIPGSPAALSPRSAGEGVGRAGYLPAFKRDLQLDLEVSMPTPPLTACLGLPPQSGAQESGLSTDSSPLKSCSSSVSTSRVPSVVSVGRALQSAAAAAA